MYFPLYPGPVCLPVLRNPGLCFLPLHPPETLSSWCLSAALHFVTPTKKRFPEASKRGRGWERVDGSLSSNMMAMGWITSHCECMGIKGCFHHGYEEIMKRVLTSVREPQKLKRDPRKKLREGPYAGEVYLWCS